MPRRGDPVHAVAKVAMKKHFVNTRGDPIKTPFYQSQLQVLYEDDFFGWIVSDVLKELVEDGFLVVLDQTDIPEFNNLKYVSRIKFFANKAALNSPSEIELMKTHALNTAKLVDKYSEPENSRMLGNQLESLVKNELNIQQFDIIGVNANELDEKKWRETDHNLDIIAKKRDNDFTIGVEVKNTLDVMNPNEIDVKIDICKHLGIIPVFACRWNKPYFECIRRQGGFSWIFKTQMYPYGNEGFTKELYQKLSVETKKNGRGHILQFPITVRNELPEKSIRSFKTWVSENENNPPEIDTSFRCTQSSV